MKERILITGGAGFVGSHLADQLLKEGYAVRVLDNLTQQVHGDQEWPDYLNQYVERVEGDVRDAAKVEEALQDVSAVYHFAAAVGVGQSMYQINHYTDVNNRGTAVLLEALSKRPVKKLVVASSMSLYGEGLYRDASGNIYSPPERSVKAFAEGQWDVFYGGEALQPVATPETKLPSPSSVYALSKYDQERLCLIVGSAYNIPVTALRFFNIYGPRQALSNPYTGVLAIFSSRFLNNKPPIIFEDGKQRRDFVSVHDITRACVLALENSNADGEVFNIGSGENYSIADIATKVGQVLDKAHIAPEITGEYRVGDIRHCFSNIDKARNLLGYQPRVSLEDGLEELSQWLQGKASFDRVDTMRNELFSRGLSL
ncbi:NAD-dependent epimerase/dehydratase family protein [Cellvibrio sp. ARAG 10.3]|uniref:NAD-dependent epimerase/dehydratase family protein n=1 Tax=Cellvibrio sp. ARAG 10.3 TaxID=3451358 RepID=UPI003F44B38F